MRTKVIIREINLLPSPDIILEENEILIVIGPNNCGKSLFLRELEHCIRHNPLGNSDNLKIIDKVILKKQGTFEDLKSDITENSKPSEYPGEVKFADQKSMHTVYFEGVWADDSQLDQICSLYLRTLYTVGRIQLSDPVEAIDFHKTMPLHPYQIMFRDQALEKKLSNISKKAFGKGVTLDRINGASIRMMFGELDLVHQTLEFENLLRVAELEPLHKQGDGIRSFVGLSANILTDNSCITIVDEPEAFLHPPHQKLLGRLIGDELTSKQVFIATHSLDFIKGILESKNKNVKIIRLNRENDDVTVSAVMPNKLLEISNNSLLKHTNILDGLFHEQLILCEGDSDCRFFTALIDSIPTAGIKKFPDTLFAHCGGKTRFVTIVPVIRDFGIALKIIADFDLLNDEQNIEKLFKACGGEWESISSDYRSFKNSVVQMADKDLKIEDLQKKFSDFLSQVPQKTFNKKDLSVLRDSLKIQSGWDIVKKHGKSILTGGAIIAFEKIDVALRRQGIYILSVGEMESYYKKCTLHGPAWIDEILSSNFLLEKDFDPAREFIQEVIS